MEQTQRLLHNRISFINKDEYAMAGRQQDKRNAFTLKTRILFYLFTYF